jgi:hypothetical protein
MNFDAELHLATNRILLAYQDTTESQGLLVKDLASSIITRMPSPYAEGPRWSPDGLRFSYFGDGRLYTHEPTETKPAKVIELLGYHAGF